MRKLIPIFHHHSIDDKCVIKNELTGNTIKYQITNAGYYIAHICEFGKRKAVTVHRLIALTFIENEHNYPEVNHIDCNKLNNSIDNLEWCSRIHNQRHIWKMGFGEKIREKARERMAVIGKNYSAQNTRHCLESNIRLSKRVAQKTMTGELVAEFASIKLARRSTGIHNVNHVISGRQKQAGGYKWELI